MLFTPWLATFRNQVRARSRRSLTRREMSAPRKPLSVELLENRTLLTGPGFVSVSPNIGDFLQDGEVRTEKPEEFVFQFSPGQSIEPATLNAIQITAAAHDGQFRPASVVTDFDTGGQAVLRVGARRVGTGENGSSLIIQSADNSGNGATVSVAAASNEIQEIDLGSQITGGTFRLFFGGNSTADINFDATAADVQAALEALPNVDPGDLSIAGGSLPGTPVTVEFAGQFAQTNVPQLFLLGNTLTNNEQQAISVTGAPTAGNFTLSLVDGGAGINGTSNPIDFDALALNERQLISLTGAPTGGNFTLAFNDAGSGINGTSNNIAFNANAAAVQTAIEGGIPGLVGNIQVTGGALPGTVTIEFIGALAGMNVASFTVGANNLTGGTAPAPNIQTSESVLGALEAGIPALAGNINVTGGPLPGSVTIEFTGTLADTNLAEFTIGTNNVTGGAPAIATVSDGNQSANGVTTTQTASTSELTLTLDSNAGNPTTAGSLINFVNNDPVASQVLSAELLEGSLTQDISGVTPRTVTLTGAGAASAISDLGTGTDLRVQITADASGTDGNLISVQLNRLNLGAISSNPQISVTGNRIEVVLNENPAAQTTAQNLVDRLNSVAGSLINASIPIGMGTTVVSGVQDGTILRLEGADSVVNPGFRGIGNTENEVIFRFAEPLSDDIYRVEILGAGTSVLTSSILTNTDGEAFKDGADEFLTTTLNLGGQVTAVVPQPVLRDQVLNVESIASLTDGDTITIDPGTSPDSFATAADDFGTAGVAEITFEAIDAGTAGNGITVTITKSDQGMAGLPLVTVDGRAISISLNSSAGNESTADDLIAAVEGNAQASDLLTATLTGTGTGAEDVTTPAGATTALTLGGAVDLFTFEFNDTSVEAAGTVRTGNIAIDYDSTADDEAALATLIESAINGTTIADPDVEASASGSSMTLTGGAFDVRATVTQQSSAISVRAGGLTQRRDTVNVYFTEDELNRSLAEDPVFYRLFNTNETFARDDANVQIPTEVTYDPVNHTATLVFASDLADATYRLRLGESEEANNTDATAVEVGTIFDVTEYFTTALIGDDMSQGLADVDLYEVTLNPGATINAGVAAGGTLDAVVRLFNSAGMAVAAGNDNPGGGFTDQLSFMSPGGGTFYVGVSSFDNTGYELDGDAAVDGATSGSYTLTITSNGTISTSDDNSSFDSASDAGILAGGLQRISSQIQPQTTLLPPPAGGSDEPGHREIPAESHGAGSGTTPAAAGSVGTVAFSFPVVYGQDSQGNDLFNQITADQKTRAREIFEIYSDLYGFEVAEVTNGGIGIVTGDPRAVSPTIPVNAVGGIAGGGLAVMNSFVGGGFTAAESEFGASWMGIALHEIGHTIGVVHSYDIRSVQGNGTSGEDQFPGNNDIVHGRRIHPNDANDIDIYRFEVEESGTLAAEIVAERMNASSLLNSALKLYREDAMSGERILIAQNDDYFSNDSYIELDLDPGTYFIGVSSTGNTDYDPTVSDTGFNGTSDGAYDLKLSFEASSRSSLSDMTGTDFDGDNDGQAGGAHEFHFRSADTVFVDKTVITNLTSSINSTQTTINVSDNTVFDQTAPFDILIGTERLTVTAVGMTGTSLTVTRGVGATTPSSHVSGTPVRPFTADGSESNPFGLISSALSASSPGEIIRIVGNGGADNDILTTADNRPYLVGLNDSAIALEDGSKFEVPRNVVVQIDAGTIVKLDSTVIDAGSSAVGIDRSGGAIQVLGMPGNEAQFTSSKDDALGGNSDGSGPPAQAEDWGGLVFRSDSDLQDATSAFDDPGIFLNYVNQAAIQFGGGRVIVDSVEQPFSPIHIVSTRPTITNNEISNSADAAMSANPNAFDDSRGRIGPEFHGNILTDNTINGLFVRIETQFGQPIDRLTRTARFDDTDLVHVITENLEIVGNPGGPLNGTPRPSGRLAIDPGVVVKLGAARIEGLRGNSHLIAEGTAENPVIITSVLDDRFGAGGTFDTTNNQNVQTASAGDWGGLIFNATSRGSIDNAFIAFGGGETPIEGSIDRFNTIEVHHQADLRLANSILEDNDVGNGGSRNGRGSTAEATIFVRQAQPIIVNNIFRRNAGTIIHVNANALLAEFQRDTGRSTGDIGDFHQFADNHGPLVRLNRTADNDFNGMEVRGEVLTTESIWDDTDIVHILRNEITVDQHHSYSGLRLQSNPGESLVVKAQGGNAGLTADGIFLDIDDRIGGTVQVVGRPGFPVVMTSLDDCSVGAGLTPEGFPQLFTNGSCSPAMTVSADVIDVVLVLDDTASFSGSGATLISVFPQIVADLQAALPGADFAFSVTRFEEYADSNDGFRPFILNQPLVATTDPQFQTAIDAALARVNPPQGSGRDETYIEALFQIATGAGYDGNNDGDVIDSGAAGLVTTQVNPPNGGDVPDFASFTPDPTGDPNGPVLPPAGTIGGVGFRATSTQRIVLLGTDGALNVEDDGNTTYNGVGGATAQITEFRPGGEGSFGVNGGAPGATIQNTVDQLIANNIKVIGLGGMAGGFGGSNDVQTPLTALARLTGATDPTGVPLYFDIDPNNGPLIADAIVQAVTGVVPGLEASPGDWRGLRFTSESNDRNVRLELETEDANNGGVEINNNQGNAQFLGELAPQHITGPTPTVYTAIDTTFRLDGDDNRPLGFEIHGHISADDPGDVDVYSFKATAGSEVWFDLDQTRGAAVDPVIELVQADGVVLARARYDHTTDSVDLDTNFGATGSAGPLTKFNALGGDYYSFNPYDTGFRATLPGAVGAVGTYFVRVRSNQATEAATDNAALLDQGLTSGQYKLQIRLRQVDEKPGSTVRFADIRFATDAIKIEGLPTHSPLLADALETTTANGPGQTPQALGNLLESDLNTLNVGGTLSGSTDVDTYQFNVDYATTILGPSIQSIGGVNDGGKTWTTVFDVDYADGLTRGDTTLTVYDSNGIPILIGRESNIEDDQPATGNANDLDDLLRGSIGKLDPFIGPVQLNAGTPGATTNYTTALSSNSQLNQQLDQTFDETPKSALVRLEPVNSVTRIIDDRIGEQGYDSNGANVAPFNANVNNVTPGGGLFDITDATTLGLRVQQFDLGDVPLFVNNGNLQNVNALYGQLVDSITTGANNDITDIAMRSDGVLYGYRDNGNPTNGAVSELVTFDLLNAGNGAITPVGGHGIPTGVAANTTFDNVTNVRTGDETVSAIAWRRTGNTQWELYYAVNEDGNSKLYEANPNTGSAASAGATAGFRGDIQPAGVGFGEGSVVISGERGTATIRYQAREAGPTGNGITVNISRNLGGGGPTVSVTGSTINVRVNTDNTPGNTATEIVNAINANTQAQNLVTVSLTGTAGATLGNNDDSGSTFAGGTTTSGGTGTPINGNVTGLAADSFTNGQLYGVTSAGEFLRINPGGGTGQFQFNATTTVVRDFRALGILGATERFTGLTLGPQNLEGGIYQNTFFASTSAGRLLSIDTNGNGVIAFDSNGEVQRISIDPGTPGPADGTFTLTYDDGAQAFTTDPIQFDAPSFVSVNEAVEIETVAYDGTFTLTFVDDNGHVTSLLDGIVDDMITTFDVDDASGLGSPDALDPTVIQIDGEQLHVTDVTGNRLTVVRGRNGTMAAAHLSDATVSEVMTTTITTNLTMGTTTIDVVDGFILPSGTFEIRIGTEDIRVDSIAGDTLTLTRGINGTADQDHLAGATVSQIDTTAGIPYNAMATDVATALGTLSGVGATNVTGVDGPLTGLGLTNGTPATLEFVNTLAGLDLDALTFDTAGLEGDEIQSFTVPNEIDGGTFTLSFGANTTPGLPFNETQANIEIALENLASIQALGGDVQVSGTLPGQMDVQFIGAAEDTNIPTQLTIDSSGLVNNERQRLLMIGGPTSGMFRLTFGGVETTVDIAFDANAAAVQAALETIPALNSAISVTGTNISTGVFVEFIAALADTNVGLITESSPALTGGTAPTVTTLLLENGDQSGNAFTSRQGTMVDVELNSLDDGITSVFDALVALPSLNANEIQVNGGPLPGTPIDVTFLTGVDEIEMTVRNDFMLNNSSAMVTTVGVVGDGAADNSIISAGLGNTTGLAFSPLDFNLWHPTNRRGAADEPGHGVNAAYDMSRGSAAGGTSFYFGLEEGVSGAAINYDSNGQYGVLVDDYQRDLTSTNLIGNNYNLPAGAYGTLISDTFDLVSSTSTAVDQDDRPTLYFNYFLESEDTNAAVTRDAARVFITNDGGTSWHLLATNNTPLNGNGNPTGDDTTEIPYFQSHSALANTSDARQRVQGLFDTGEWRQARVDLSDFTGQTDLQLRFDFSTAGTITDPDVTNNNPELQTHLRNELGTLTIDGAGDLNATSRGQNNQFEGFYIDDIIVGWSERGEMITAAAANQTPFTVPQPPASLMLPEELLAGQYQLEIRRGFEYAGAVSATDPEITVNSIFDTNTRFIPGSTLGLPNVSDDFEGDGMDPTTIGFDPAVGWTLNSAGSNSPWQTGLVAEAPATNLNGAIADTDIIIQVVDGSIFAADDLILVDDVEPMLVVTRIGNFLTVARGPGAIAHAGGVAVSHLNVTAESGLINDNQLSAMQVTATTGAVTFDYRVDADAGDFFRVFVDTLGGVEGAAFESSDTGGAFETTTISVTPGVHTFYFVYQKNGSDPTTGNPLLKANTDERVIIDNVVFAGIGNTFVRGDRNLERQQGHFQIESNIIRDVADTGIDILAAPRDAGTNFASPGSPINFGTINADRLAPGITIVNNVIAGYGTAGIQFGGDPLSGGDATNPASAVPFGKIINNTVYGGDTPAGTGVIVHDNASPTLLNNLFANNDTPITVDGSSSSTVVARTFFHNNLNAGVQGQNFIDENDQTTPTPLFVNPTINNFYLADGSEAIDRSLGSLADRANFVSFKTELQLPNSDVFSPDRDLFGQKRIDDPTQVPSGLGGEVFNDLGAVERADFIGGTTILTVPLDNGTDDLDPLDAVVHVDEPDLFTQIIVQFTDAGIGIDDTTVRSNGQQFTLTVQTRQGTRVFNGNTEITDPLAPTLNEFYSFAYNDNTNEAILTSSTLFPQDARYTLTIDNSVSNGILDFAGNPLIPNQLDGTVRFDLLVTSGANDPPTNMVPGPQTVAENTVPAPTVLTFSSMDGNVISVDDPDAFINTDELQVTLNATNGTVTLPANFATLVTLDAGSGTNDTSVTFTGTIADLNTLFAGGTVTANKLQFVPNLNFNGAANLEVVTNDLGNFSAPPSDPMEDRDDIAINVTPVNSAPTATAPATDSVLEDGILTFSGTVSVSDGDDGNLDIVQVTLSITNGSLALNGTTMLDDSFNDSSGTGDLDGSDGTLEFRGMVSDINTALNGLEYEPDPNYNNSNTSPFTPDVLTLTINDLGNTGAGTALASTATVDVTVTAVNDEPVNELDGSAIVGTPRIQALEHRPAEPAVIFDGSGPDNPLLSVSDVDVGEATVDTDVLSVTLTATSGTITLAQTTGLTFNPVGMSNDGVDDATLTFSGTVANINAALDGLAFNLLPGFSTNGVGPFASLQIVTSDEGRTGPMGGTLTDDDTIEIDVIERNDNPVNTVPGTQVIDEDQASPLIFTTGNLISLMDVDAGAADIQISLSVNNGAIALDPADVGVLTTVFSDAQGTADTDGADGDLVVRGTVTELNAALDGLTYVPSTHFNGTDTLTITTNDLGNTGNGGPMTDTDSVTITVNPTNDDPAVELGSAMGSTLTVNATEDTDFTFSVAANNQIVASDPLDAITAAGTEIYEISLSIAGAMPGALTLPSTAGLDFGQAGGDNDGSDGSLLFQGTLSNINAALNGLVYSPEPGVTDTSRTLTVTVDDLGNIDSDLMPSLTGTGTVTIIIDGSNDPPVNTVPVAGPLTTTDEDVDLVFSGLNGNQISIEDIDASTSPVQVTLSSTNGVVSLDGVAGLTFSFSDANGTGVGDGMDDATMTFRGTIGAINTALNGLSFTPDLNYNGAASLTITTNDLGNTGVGSPLSDSDTVGITVTAVNDEPVIDGPVGLTVNEDSNVTISAANMNGVSVDDIDLGSGKFAVTISLDHGSLTLRRTTGLTFTGGADGTSSMTFTGSRTAVNSALDGSIYTPDPGYSGSDTLSLTVSDQGSSGSGGPQMDALDIPVTVRGINDDPVLTLADTTVSTAEDVALSFSTSTMNQISVADVDVLDGDGRVEATISVTSGTLTLSTLNNITVDSGANSSASLTFSGPIGDVNVALSGLVYQPNLDFSGTDTLNVSVSDLGNAGFMATPLTDSGAITITVDAVNDAPVNSVPGPQSTPEDTDLSFSPNVVPNGISISDVDAGSDSVEVILTVSNGALSLGGTSGLDFGQTGGDSDGSDGSLRFQGSIASIVTALDGLTYSPTLDFSGLSVLTLTTSDLGNNGAGSIESDTDLIEITVDPVNDRPVAIADTYTLQVGETLTVNDTLGLDGNPNNDSVLLNDSDPDGDSIFAIADTAPAFHNGVFTLNPNGTFTYQHDGSANYSDSFTYHATDGVLDSTPPVTVTFAINATPVVTGDTFSLDENTLNGTVVGTVSATDANGDSLQFSFTGGNTSSAFAIDNNGQITVSNSSALDFESNSAFALVVEVTDGNGGTSNAAVDVNLNDLSEAVVISSSDFSDDGLTIVRSGSRVRVINTVTGLDVIPAHEINQIDSLNVTGRDSADDTLTVDFSNGNPIPTPGISYDGGTGGNDTLDLIGGSVTDVSHNFTSSSSGDVTVDGSMLSYTGLEPINDLLAAQTRSFTFGATADAVTVEDIGSSNDGRVRISSVSSSETVDFNVPATSIEVLLGGANDTLNVTSLDGNFLGTFIVSGEDGNDTIDVSGLGTATSISGGAGNDNIIGGSGADLVFGDAGNDQIDGGAGNDIVFGGAGADILTGGDGTNQLHGQGTSFDVVRETVSGTVVLTDSSSQTASLTWATGSNILRKDEFIELTGTSGDENIDLSGFDLHPRGITVLAGEGADVIIGSPLADSLEGQGGNDNISGGAGADFIDLGDGNDIGSGDDGADLIFGGAGDDNINGGNQTDIIDAGLADTLDIVNGGGSSADRLLVELSGNVTFNGKIIPRNGTGNILIQRVEKLQITGSPGDDRFDFSDYFGAVTVNAGDGDDTYIGTEQGDVVLGGNGDDVVDGRGGNDYVLGGAGNDAMRGGEGNDIFVGDLGDDTMLGGVGNDFLLGSGGRDVILGEEGDDVVRGQGTSDQVSAGGNGVAPSSGDILLIDAVDQVFGADLLFDFDALL